MSNQSLVFASIIVLAGVAAHAVSAKSPGAMSATDFAQAAAQSDQFEILEGRTVLAQSRNLQVRAFAQQMIQDHTQTTAALRQAAMKSGLTPPTPSLGGDQAKMLGSLQSLRGPDFDRAYAKQQALAHTSALVVEQGYAAQGADPNLRQAAQSAVPMIQQHLRQAQQMHLALGDS